MQATHDICRILFCCAKQRTFSSSFFGKSRFGSLLVRVFVAVLICGMAQPIMAATYYVAKTGADSNPGTEALPWLTIQKAANTVVAGDTVQVRSGIYNEKVNCTTAAGAADKPITFLADGSVTNFGWYLSQPYYTVQGFTVTGETIPSYQGTFVIRKTAHGTKLIENVIAQLPSLVSVYGIWMEPDTANFGVNPSNCVIRGNRIIDPSFHALALAGQGHLVEGNYFTGTKGADAIRAMSSNTIIRGNTFDNWSNLVGSTNHPDLIQSFADNGEIALNVIVEGNFAVNCIGTQIGNITDTQKVPTGNVGYWTWRNNIFINVEYVMSIYADNFTFYNNVFYKSGRNSGSPIMFRTSNDRGVAHYGKVFNNLFIECGSVPTSAYYGWYSVESAADKPAVVGFEADHNLVIGTGAGTTKIGFNEPHGLNGVQPRFVDADRLDFHLAEGSPGIGAGKNFYDLFTTDFSGATRDSSLPWDLGAYAFNGAKPPAPQNFRALLGQ